MLTTGPIAAAACSEAGSPVSGWLVGTMASMPGGRSSGPTCGVRPVGSSEPGGMPGREAIVGASAGMELAYPPGMVSRLTWLIATASISAALLPLEAGMLEGSSLMAPAAGERQWESKRGCGGARLQHVGAAGWKGMA